MEKIVSNRYENINFINFLRLQRHNSDQISLKIVK